jgi:hypothetical protein
MIIVTDIQQRTPEWDILRSGKVTGTGLKKLVSSRKDTREDYFYEVLAGRLTTETTQYETAMNRGVRLEDEAIAQFENLKGILVDKAGFCQSSENEWIGYSPDGLIKVGKTYSEDVEVKCLASKNHLRIWLENTIPEEHEAQIIHSFIVNPKLKKRYFISYDPRISIHPIHIIEVSRKDYEEKIEDYKQKEEDFIKEINKKLIEINKI